MIIAVDFDGILCKNEFPDIGQPNYDVISLVRQLYDKGHEIILWTSRIDEKLQEALDWCKSYGLKFSAVNDNAPSNLGIYGTNPRKIFADIYVDDHNLEYVMSDNRYVNSEEFLITYLKRGVRKWKTEEN